MTEFSPQAAARWLGSHPRYQRTVDQALRCELCSSLVDSPARHTEWHASLGRLLAALVLGLVEREEGSGGLPAS